MPPNARSFGYGKRRRCPMGTLGGTVSMASKCSQGRWSWSAQITVVQEMLS